MKCIYIVGQTLFLKQSSEKCQFNYGTAFGLAKFLSKTWRQGAFHLTSGADNCESTVGPWACLGVGLLMPTTKGSTGKCPGCSWMLEGFKDTEPRWKSTSLPPFCRYRPVFVMECLFPMWRFEPGTPQTLQRWPWQMLLFYKSSTTDICKLQCALAVQHHAFWRQWDTSRFGAQQ